MDPWQGGEQGDDSKPVLQICSYCLVKTQKVAFAELVLFATQFQPLASLQVNSPMKCKFEFGRKWKRKREWSNGKRSSLRTTMDKSEKLPDLSCFICLLYR